MDINYGIILQKKLAALLEYFYLLQNFHARNSIFAFIVLQKNIANYGI